MHNRIYSSQETKVIFAERLDLRKKLIESPSVKYSHICSDRSSESLKIRHCHETVEILYVVKGRGKYIVEGTEFEFSSGSALLIKPFQYHCVFVDMDEGYERYILQFPVSTIFKELRKQFESVAGDIKEDSGFYCSAESFKAPILSVFKRFEQSSEIPEEERDAFFRILVSELVSIIALPSKQIIKPHEAELGAKIVKYVNMFLDTHIRLDDVAKRFFMSKFYLCHLFKEYSGVSLHAYIAQKRVAYAKQLMALGETAAGAAYKVGFGDYSAFYRAFVKMYGKPPTAK